jgi:hypothetical protein
MTVGEGATATPRLVLDADVDMGEILVLNDDDVDIEGNRGEFHHNSRDDVDHRDANAEACAT